MFLDPLDGTSVVHAVDFLQHQRKSSAESHKHSTYVKMRPQEIEDVISVLARFWLRDAIAD
jgi:hypothetical protein